MPPLQDNQYYECNEQELCLRCGLCCDGTLFENAKIADSDLVSLEKQPMDFLIDEKNHNFKLPCPYHVKKRCSIYLEWRPKICSGFVCGIIQKLRSGELVFSQAVNLVDHALSHAEKVRKMLSPFAGNGRQSLEYMFNVYVATNPVPDQLIMLEYAALQHRLKRDFHKKKTNDTITCQSKTPVLDKNSGILL